LLKGKERENKIPPLSPFVKGGKKFTSLEKRKAIYMFKYFYMRKWHMALAVVVICLVLIQSPCYNFKNKIKGGNQK
jgi:uncharacterized membrane protein YozB (DUF420 family)